MRYCRRCGTQLPDGAVFCPSCGANVQNDVCSENNGNAQYSGARTFDSEYCQSNNYSKTSSNGNTDGYSALTILGVVFAFLSSIVGLILSIFAFNEAKRLGSEKNESLSKLGIILSAVFLGLKFLFVTLMFCLFIAGIVSLGSVL